MGAPSSLPSRPPSMAPIDACTTSVTLSTASSAIFATDAARLSAAVEGVRSLAGAGPRPGLDLRLGCAVGSLGGTGAVLLPPTGSVCSVAVSVGAGLGAGSVAVSVGAGCDGWCGAGCDERSGAGRDDRCGAGCDDRCGAGCDDWCGVGCDDWCGAGCDDRCG